MTWFSYGGTHTCNDAGVGLELTSSYFKENPSKAKKACLDMMVNRLQELQERLPKVYQSDILMKNKLLSACAGVDECLLARQKVAPSLNGVIADLHTSIATYPTTKSEKKPDVNALLTALFTERKRRGYQKSDKGKEESFVLCMQEDWMLEDQPYEGRKYCRTLRNNKKIRAFFISCYMTGADDGESPPEDDGPDIDLEDLRDGLCIGNDESDSDDGQP